MMNDTYQNHNFDQENGWNSTGPDSAERNGGNGASNESRTSESQASRRRRPHKGHRIAALVLCLVLGICAGFGGGILYKNHDSGRVSDAGDVSEPGGSSLESETGREAEDAPQTADSESSNPSDAGGSDEQTEKKPLTLTTDSHGKDLSIAEIAATAADSVVEITTESVTTGNFMQQYVSSGAGSGVIVTDDGYIITNNHVIEGASQITVTLTNQTSYDATLVGRDEQLDVGLLKIDAEGLKPAFFGDSDKLVVGEEVVAIGNPLGQLGGTVTNGIISALDRAITMDDRTMNLLQTNAAINPGNSGGGLFNTEGQLIGLVVAKSSGSDVEGLGFAIPINDVAEILNDLLDYGYVRNRVALGVSLLDVTSEQMAYMYRVPSVGTYIYSVEEDSAAEKAGLSPGDRILSVNDTEIGSSEDLKNLLTSVKVGDTLHFSISRNGRDLSVDVVAGEYVPDDIAKARGIDDPNA